MYIFREMSGKADQDGVVVYLQSESGQHHFGRGIHEYSQE